MPQYSPAFKSRMLRRLVGLSAMSAMSANALAHEVGREGAIVLRDPHRRMHVEPRVRPGEHAGGLVLALLARVSRVLALVDECAAELVASD